MKYSTIGAGLPQISQISLGSWNTFSRLSVEENIALVRRALDLGINLFDVGYYWDKPDTESVFGEVMKRLGAPRSAYFLVEKLWLWDYPQQSFDQQIKTSLKRLAVEQVDLISVSRPLPELDFIGICEEVAALVQTGQARSWGVTNWEAGQVWRVKQDFESRGLPTPRLIQLQYNVARRAIVESPEFDRLFAETDIKLCAANTLEGGILAGHLDRDRVNPSEMARGAQPNERNICRDSGGVRDEIRNRQARLESIAEEFGLTAAQAAIAFTFAHSALATALIGVTKVLDLEQNALALDVADLEGLRAALSPLSVKGVAHPKLFSPSEENA